MDEYTRANRAIWDAWTTGDLNSAHHQDVARFRSGASTLRAIEREELGDVAGKSLLHLLCNMGSDTLSWARLGAAVTGVDLSAAAIERARALAREAGIEAGIEAGSAARFLCSDLYALPQMLDEQFDIVFTSYGALCWMPDLDRWARVVARYVKPGGVFYIVDMHPFANALTADPDDATGLRFAAAHPYFHAATLPPEETSAGAIYSWSYGLGEVISALISAGLRLEYLHEFPLAFYQRFPTLVRGEDGWWRWPTPERTLPLLFSLRARK